uniref:Reverse transcriptase domain-containing protein n=1 Tax=Tanacetum cinerariifolium TaxID=118510 RepID=A0A6L2KPL3_TANCI|nr:reverse transcriptase domain-containing protein [Tanacetum cinerariifolium]
MSCQSPQEVRSIQSSQEVKSSQSPQEEDENLNTKAPGTGRTPPGGTYAPASQAQGGPSPAFVKENIDVLRTMIKELDNRGQDKVTRRKLFNEESSGARSENSQISPSTEEVGGTLLMGPLGQGTKVGLDLLRNIKRVSRGRRGSLSPIAKKYEKDLTKIHGIKRKLNKGIQAFMDRFKVERAHIKGVPLVLRIFAFMHGHGHPELAKKLNDKISKTVDEMWERVGAFIRGEMDAKPPKSSDLLGGKRVLVKLSGRKTRMGLEVEVIEGGKKKHKDLKADTLSKLEAVQLDHLSKEVLDVLNERFVEAQEVNMVVEEEGLTWMTLIRNYLEKEIMLDDLVEARTLMKKIGNYTMEDGVLYRKSYLVLLMRDARKLIRACDDCHAHVSVPRLPKEYMISVTSAWPFIKFGILATIIIDNVTQFVNDPFKKWAAKLKIQLISTLVYHPQGNGALERENKSLLKGIKTILEKGGST